jgi:hypothetical protein
MRILISLIICFTSIYSYPQYAMARGNNSGSTGNSFYGSSHNDSFNSSFGNIHSVRTYTKQNGTTVNSHLSGNPRSGIHCHYNVCN